MLYACSRWHGHVENDAEVQRSQPSRIPAVPNLKEVQAASLLLGVHKPCPSVHLPVTVPKRPGCLIQPIALKNEHSSYYQKSQQTDAGNYSSSSASQVARQHLGTLMLPSAEPHQDQMEVTQTQL